MADYLLVFFKVGDKKTAPGKEYLGLKDGMPICYIDPNEWNPTISTHMERVFCCLKLPLLWKANIVTALQPNQDDQHVDPATYRARKSLINFPELETDLKIPNLVKDLRSTKVVPILDGTKLPPSILKSSDQLNPPAIDSNAVSAGSYTAGSGGNYTTWALAFADIANLTADLLFTQIDNTIETASSVMTEALGGFDFTITSNASHLGNPNNGWVTTHNFDGILFNFQATGIGNIEVKDLHINIQAVQAGASLIIYSHPNNNHTGNFIVHDNMIDAAGKKARAIYIQSTSPTPNPLVYNNTIWDIVGLGVGISNVANNADAEIENNTIYSCVIGIDANTKLGVFTNNVCIANGTDFLNIGVVVTGNNNASDDGTAANGNWGAGANNVPNITPANEFASLNDTSRNFLKCSRGGDNIFKSGKAPVVGANTTGIRGNARPHSTQYSIGADEYDHRIYYSTGTDAGNLYADNATAVDGVLTLASAAATKIGVGDEINQGANKYYIYQRNSSTEFLIQSAVGGKNIDFGLGAITIKRAYNAISTAEAGASDATHLNNVDLTAIDVQLLFPCYNDGIDSLARVTFAGWTVDATRFIKMYTPVSSSEVGVTQRHNGIPGTGYRLILSDPGDALIMADQDYSIIEGIEVQNTAAGNAEGISIREGYCTIAYCLISIPNTAGITNIAKAIDFNGNDGFNVKIYNNFIFNVGTATALKGIAIDNTTYGLAHTMVIYNNSIYNVPSTTEGRGIQLTDANTTLFLKNNIVQLTTTADYNFAGIGAITSATNISKDATSPDAAFRNKTINFIDPSNGDLHLNGGDADAIDAGTNLNPDADGELSFDDDVEGKSRPQGAAWDIGADEKTAAPVLAGICWACRKYW